MGIISWLRNRKKDDSEATRILSELGCFRLVNGITPSMCNDGIIRGLIDTYRKQGKTKTANDLENWLKNNRRRLK